MLFDLIDEEEGVKDAKKFLTDIQVSNNTKPYSFGRSSSTASPSRRAGFPADTSSTVATPMYGFDRPEPKTPTSSKAKEAYDYYVKVRKVSPHVAAGIVGNMQKESGMDVNAVGDSGTSHGLVQWHNERYTGLQRYAAKRGKHHSDFHTQLDYALDEQPETIAKMERSGDHRKATMIYTNEFERPNPKTADYNARMSAADSVYGTKGMRRYSFGGTPVTGYFDENLKEGEYLSQHRAKPDATKVVRPRKGYSIFTPVETRNSQKPFVDSQFNEAIGNFSENLGAASMMNDYQPQMTDVTARPKATIPYGTNMPAPIVVKEFGRWNKNRPGTLRHFNLPKYDTKTKSNNYNGNGKIMRYGGLPKYATGAEIGTGLSLLGDTVGSFDTNTRYSDPTLSTVGGALKGAAAGTAILPGIGTAVGAVVGGVGGLLGAKKQKALYEKKMAQDQAMFNEYMKQRSNGILENYPTLGQPIGRYRYGGNPRKRSNPIHEGAEFTQNWAKRRGEQGFMGATPEDAEGLTEPIGLPQHEIQNKIDKLGGGNARNTGLVSGGYYDESTNQSYIANNTSKRIQRGNAAHETAHKWQTNMSKNHSGFVDVGLQMIGLKDNPVQDSYDNINTEIKRSGKSKDAYFGSPNEVHARVIEGRQSLKLTPDDVFTKEHLQQLKMVNPGKYKELSKILDDEGIINSFNKTVSINNTKDNGTRKARYGGYVRFALGGPIKPPKSFYQGKPTDWQSGGMAQWGNNDIPASSGTYSDSLELYNYGVNAQKAYNEAKKRNDRNAMGNIRYDAMDVKANNGIKPILNQGRPMGADSDMDFVRIHEGIKPTDHTYDNVTSTEVPVWKKPQRKLGQLFSKKPEKYGFGGTPVTPVAQFTDSNGNSVSLRKKKTTPTRPYQIKRNPAKNNPVFSQAAMGGTVQPRYEAEHGEVIVGDDVSYTGGKQLASNLHKIVGKTHDQYNPNTVNGTGEDVEGGDFVFSDRLNVAPKTSFAKYAEKLARRKAKAEKKLQSNDYIELNTGKLLAQQVDQQLEQLSGVQEQMKGQLGIMRYGGYTMTYGMNKKNLFKRKREHDDEGDHEYRALGGPTRPKKPKTSDAEYYAELNKRKARYAEPNPVIDVPAGTYYHPAPTKKPEKPVVSSAKPKVKPAPTRKPLVATTKPKPVAKPKPQVATTNPLGVPVKPFIDNGKLNPTITPAVAAKLSIRTPSQLGIRNNKPNLGVRTTTPLTNGVVSASKATDATNAFAASNPQVASTTPDLTNDAVSLGLIASNFLSTRNNINRYQTRVPANMMHSYNYGYYDRSQGLRTQVNKAVSGVNANPYADTVQRVGAFAKGVDATNQINQEEANRKMQYDSEYRAQNTQIDNVNTQILNQAQNEQINNENDKIAAQTENNSTLFNNLNEFMASGAERKGKMKSMSYIGAKLRRRGVTDSEVFGN